MIGYFAPGAWLRDLRGRLDEKKTLRLLAAFERGGEAGLERALDELIRSELRKYRRERKFLRLAALLMFWRK
jgi:hypothetical protein